MEVEPTVQASETTEPIVARAVIYLRVSTNSQAETDFDAEGLSIKAQRGECRTRAKALGATVVDEYVDIGESARSADRGQLQAMLNRLEAHGDVDYVIVHKLDRLARNRLDDLSITLAIQKAGAKLISCSENIDETPQGRFMHAVMAGVAELYSANLGAEALKGMRQKAKLGGTPHVAPVGYINVIKMIDSHQVRTIEIDPERADHVVWAFEQYATNEWSLRVLTEMLADRGLTARPTPKRPAKPLSLSNVQRMLRNPYYVGIVTFEGVQYAGRHEPLVDPVLFDTVQRVHHREEPIWRTSRPPPALPQGNSLLRYLRRPVEHLLQPRQGRAVWLLLLPQPAARRRLHAAVDSNGHSRVTCGRLLAAHSPE